MENKTSHGDKEKIDFVRMGAIIKEARQNMSLTQEQLSEIVDVTPAFIGHIERGERSVSLKTLFAIGKKLNLSFDYLLTTEVSYTPEQQTVRAFEQLIEGSSQRAQEAVLDVVRAAIKHF